MGNLRKQYEKETGNKTMYRKQKGSDFHFSMYVQWLENKLEPIEGVGEAVKLAQLLLFDAASILNDYPDDEDVREWKAQYEKYKLLKAATPIGGEKEWVSVKDKLPSEENGEQVEVVFYAKPFVWWAGMFTPKGKMSDKPVFQYHQHWGDDNYYTVEGVVGWLPLPKPTL